MVSGDVIVAGRVVFNLSKPFKNGVAHIKLEDISRQDIPSTVIAEQIIKNLKFPNKETKGKVCQIEFTLIGKIPDMRGTYVVTARINTSGSGKCGIGDYITMETFPVVTNGNPYYAIVRVREIQAGIRVETI